MSVEIIRDPLWNNIRLDPLSFELIDTPAFQRLRYVRQLGLAFLVYPGATHSRFEHALGTYHLARRTLDAVRGAGRLRRRSAATSACSMRVAALLHDIGHYPFSHALEEIGAMHHEDVARPLICDGEVADILRRELGADAPERIVALIRGESDSPLQGLISGSIDLDKLDYLRRDAFMCGVSYGEIDVDRLINALTIVRDPDDGRAARRHGREGIVGARVAAVREVSDVPQRVLASRRAQRDGDVQAARRRRARRRRARRAHARRLHRRRDLCTTSAQRAPSPLLRALRERRLYKRAFECPGRRPAA